MGGFGDLLGGLGDLFGGDGGDASDAVENLLDGGLAMLFGDRDEEHRSATETVDRYLTGAPRALNINDL
ncbi:MAG: hypothetical protein JO103_12055 [Candidatus Eremiobacteraeota bacterium]|nr:hypothetical protein [Candidatus Eremiobacteraeota bacterium]MBV9409206.1 hypothetical protein [Candidatus Eremiobacteraeota bacterium]